MNRKRYSFLAAALVCLLARPCLADETLPKVLGIDPQPVKAQATRIAQALEVLGSPLTAEQKKKLAAALAEPNAIASLDAIQSVFDPLCLCGIEINPESRVKVTVGPAEKQLAQHGWRVFLVKL